MLSSRTCSHWLFWTLFEWDCYDIHDMCLILSIQVSRKSQSLHDRAFINCQFSMATFSTSERKKRPKGDRWAMYIYYVVEGIQPLITVLKTTNLNWLLRVKILNSMTVPMLNTYETSNLTWQNVNLNATSMGQCLFQSVVSFTQALSWNFSCNETNIRGSNSHRALSTVNDWHLRSSIAIRWW